MDKQFHDFNDIIGNNLDYERFEKEEALVQKKQREEKYKQGKKKSKHVKDNGSADGYEWLQSLVFALLLCVLVFSFGARVIGIIGSSMHPTFENGDSVVVSDLFYKPKQGDVVVLRKEEFRYDPIIKRVIAVEGQTIDIDFDNGIVYVDDVPIDEPYIADVTHNKLDFDGEITIPENCVFVMGDNRNNSKDSRLSSLGYVDEGYIMGKVLFRVFPINKFGDFDNGYNM